MIYGFACLLGWWVNRPDDRADYQSAWGYFYAGWLFLVMFTFFYSLMLSIAIICGAKRWGTNLLARKGMVTSKWDSRIAIVLAMLYLGGGIAMEVYSLSMRQSHVITNEDFADKKR